MSSTILFLCSAQRTSSASASLITSFLRSSLSAPCGVVLKHLSIRSLQRNECPCALLLSLMALQPGHPIVAPNSSMSYLVILPLWIRAPSNGNGGIGIGSTRISGLSHVHLPSVILQSTSITFLTSYVFHLIYGFQSSDCPSPEYTVCTPNEIFCPVVSRSKPNPKLVSRIHHSVPGSCGDLLCQHCLTKWDQMLVTVSCHAVFRMVSSRTTFFDIWTRYTLHCSTNHGISGESSLSGSCVLLSMWHLIVLIIPRSSITAFSMRPFDSLSPFTASSVVTSALHIAAFTISERDYCRLCVAPQRDFAITK